jgi:hypothetical protein
MKREDAGGIYYLLVGGGKKKGYGKHPWEFLCPRHEMAGGI